MKPMQNQLVLYQLEDGLNHRLWVFYEICVLVRASFLIRKIYVMRSFR